MACLPPSMRPKTTRNQIYQTISSAFSRRSTNSPESPPFQDTSTHLSESPTARVESISASLSSRSQRIYRSISSAFSMMSQHLPESPPIQNPSAHPSGTSTPSPTFSNDGRGKKIYQSISSVFSRHTSPLVFDDSPDTCPSNATQLPAPDFLSNPDNSKAEAPPALNSGFLDAMEEVEEGSSDNHSPRSTVVSPEANLSGQP